MTTRRMQKNLTVMFTDISGFTKHTEMISRDDLMKRLDTHNQLLMPVVAHFEGKIVKTIGDAFLITFESPTNAVQCGLFMQHTLAKFNTDKTPDEQIHIKVSINSGEVTVTDTDVFGDPVNVAAKIEKATNPNEIYFTESVFLAMNKAEVPTSFVKAFRPKGAESQEIKLYKVAMDEGDERYQKIINATKIDPEKVKTRVRELSDLAEKEVTRYQDTLNALLENQGKSSRNMILAVLAAVIVLGIVIVIAVTQFGGAKTDPATQLAQDVRSYLTNKRTAEARNVVDAYVKAHGADDHSAEMLAEIRGLEVGEVAALATSLMVKGEPENAKAEIVKFFGSQKPEGEAAKLLAQCEGWLGARRLLEEGKADETLAALKTAFGETQPADDVGKLRKRANALNEAKRLLALPPGQKEPARIIGLIEEAFGNDVSNAAALPLLEEALAQEMFRIAGEHGKERGAEELEVFRKKFRHIPSWNWISTSMLMGHIWHVGYTDRGRNLTENNYFKPLRDVRAYVGKDAALLYRFGCMQFILERYNGMATALGIDCWRKAITMDPGIAARHAEFWKIYEIPLHDPDAAACGNDLTTALKYSLCLWFGGITEARELIKTTCYAELQPKMLEYVNTKEPPADENGNPENWESERINSYIILAESGDVSLIKDRFWLFRELFHDAIIDGDLTGKQLGAVFTPVMTADEYAEYRRFIQPELQQANERKGRYGTYPSGAAKIEDLLNDLKQAQPAHTQAYTE